MTNTIALTGEAALRQNIEAARAPATRRSYARAWAAYQAFAGSDMPADPYDVAVYLSELGTRTAPSTVRLHAAAIAAAHADAGEPTPTNHPGVKKAIGGHARLAGVAPEQADGIDDDAFERITATAMMPRVTRGGRIENEAQAQFRALVDCGLIGLMRDALLRRSEASALTWGDLRGQVDGTGRLFIRASKTDQIARGSIRFVSEEIVETLVTLRMMTSGEPHDRIFCLSASQICRRIAAAAAHAGLDGRYSGHSPRIGMAQDLARAGTGLVEMMVAGGWKSPNMPAYYIRNIEAGTGAVAKYYEDRE